MSLEYIFNELSFSMFPDLNAADKAIRNFVAVLKASRNIGIKPAIRSSIDLMPLEIADGYFISTWCKDNNIPKESRLYLLKLLTSNQFIPQLPDALTEDLKEIEVHHDQVSSHGLTIAYLTGNPVISLNSHTKWHPCKLPIGVKKLRVNEQTREIGIFEEHEVLLNFCILEDIGTILPQVKELQINRFSSTAEFWEKKGTLFNHLDFSPEIEKALERLGSKNPLFTQALDFLRRLNSYCSTWHEGPCLVHEALPNISTESAQTMVQYGEKRKFKNSSSQYHLCEWHGRLTPGKFRVHFCSLPDQKKIFVGYIGEKLPSVLYTT